MPPAVEFEPADDDEDGIDTPCDILVVGVQEAPAMDGFVEGLLAALGGDDEFVHLAGVSLEPGGWIQMEVFLRRELLPFVSDVRRDAVSCGIGNVFGNKGSVGVAFTCAGAKLCFLNAHLAAHTEKVKQRNADYHRIVRTMFAPRVVARMGNPHHRIWREDRRQRPTPWPPRMLPTKLVR